MKKLVLVGIMALSMASFAQNKDNIFTYEDEIKSGISVGNSARLSREVNYVEDSFEFMMMDRNNDR